MITNQSNVVSYLFFGKSADTRTLNVTIANKVVVENETRAGTESRDIKYWNVDTNTRSANGIINLSK